MKADPDSILAKLYRTCLDLQPEEAALVLENSPELEAAYKGVAVQGDSAVPENAEDEVDFHYICFVKSPKNRHLYLLDGDRKGPVDKGKVLEDGEDILGEGALAIVRGFLQREGGDGGFGLLALVESAE
jgi:ubiquitin carboxyl-terminal hydrolase L3